MCVTCASYLLNEFARVCAALLAVDGAGVHLQLADLLGQLSQRQVRVQALVLQIAVRLQAGSQVLNHSLYLREPITGQIQLQKIKNKKKKHIYIYTYKRNPVTTVCYQTQQKTTVTTLKAFKCFQSHTFH